MFRFLFFLLLVANAAFGAHLWFTALPAEADFSPRERNPEFAKIVSVVPPLDAANRAEETRKHVRSLAGSACVQFSGFAEVDLPRMREIFAAMRIADRLTERKVEEVVRYWVHLAPARDQRSAEKAAQNLRKQGVTDLSLRADNAISLGVFSSEEAARRHLVILEAKGVKGAQVGPFSREERESVFLVRDPDSALVTRLALLQRDYSGSALRAVPCPGAQIEASSGPQ